MFKEDSFLGTCPFDVVLEDTDLGFGRVGDGKEEIEKCTNLKHGDQYPILIEE